MRISGIAPDHRVELAFPRSLHEVTRVMAERFLAHGYRWDNTRAVDFREAMLQIMERKVHWAWKHFTSGAVPAERLHIHFEQEYATYVRDFPVMLGWAYVQCPVAEVRRDLAENLYEEETGGLIAGKPAPRAVPRVSARPRDGPVAVRPHRAAPAARAFRACSTSTPSAAAGRRPPR